MSKIAETSLSKDAFVKLGQTLKLESSLSGEVPPGIARARAGSMKKVGCVQFWYISQHFMQCYPFQSPWGEPACVYRGFSHAVNCGDSWNNSNLVLAADQGTFLIADNRPPVN